MPNDSQPIQTSTLDSSVTPGSPASFVASQPSDMRFATDHSSLAPHQLPELPSNQLSSPAPHIPELALNNSPQIPVPSSQPHQPLSPVTNFVSEQNQSIPPSATQLTSPAQPAWIASKKAVVAKWLVVIALTGLGMKGFFDSLYFILIEFQTFQKDLENHLINTTDINPLILKAGLLVFATALSVFFGMQLTMTSSRKLHWIKIIASILVGVLCAAVLQYANTITVLSLLKNP
ncbi:MAG: hypothetical protein ABI425_04040 [Patescibacteria group bacterium]